MKSKLKRYFWLINSLKDRPMSLKDLSELWERSPENDFRTPFSRRTFQEHKNAINDLDVGIEIVYDSKSKCYMLKSNNADEHSFARWMWNMMSLQSTMTQNASLKDRIVVKEVPSAQLYLDAVLQAIRENHVIEFSYHPFGKTAFAVSLFPYFVQMTNQRWYVFGIKAGEETLKAYALDRMESIMIKEEYFTFPEDFSAEEYLSENGIGQYKNIPIVEIVIRAYGKHVDILRSLPLHPSQQETKTEEGKSEFTYHLRPTTKFYGDILSRGIYVKVLSPWFVRKHIKESIDKLSNYYK